MWKPPNPLASSQFLLFAKDSVSRGAFVVKRVHLVAVSALASVVAAPIDATTTPDFFSRQGYLSGASGGIYAVYAWTVEGGTGAGVTVYDIEWGWNQEHEDLDSAFGAPVLIDQGDFSIFSDDQREHGTAVLGELIATRDAIGVTGIAYQSSIKLVPVNTSVHPSDPAHAIALALLDGAGPGDVILLEVQHRPVCGISDWGPVEWAQDIFSAIVEAVAAGVVVVEAAGNGSIDLDGDGCRVGGISKFPAIPPVGVRLGHPRHPYDSGAIIVGAGQPPRQCLSDCANAGAFCVADGDCAGGIFCSGCLANAHAGERTSFSTYGQRVDLQGWGSGVATTGYGAAPASGNGYSDPNEPANDDRWYRFTFDGTSSAAPMVAASAAIVQSVWKTRGHGPLKPECVRDVLVSTGTESPDEIGPRPDLRAAIDVGLQDGDNDTWPFACDCKDDDPTVKPRASENCSNGIDDDCDQDTDAGDTDCQGPSATPTHTPTRTRTRTPTLTPTGTPPATLTPTVTSTSTWTPAPTATPVPTPPGTISDGYIQVWPGAYTFLDTQVGQTSPPFPFTLRVVSASPIMLHNIFSQGPMGAAFIVSGAPAPNTFLPPGASTSFQVAFSPFAAQVLSATVAITYQRCTQISPPICDPTVYELDVDVSGTGVSPPTATPSGPTPTPGAVSFSDNFNRANSQTVGNGWAQSGNAVISGNRMVVTGNAIISRPFNFSFPARIRANIVGCGVSQNGFAHSFRVLSPSISFYGGYGLYLFQNVPGGPSAEARAFRVNNGLQDSTSSVGSPLAGTVAVDFTIAADGSINGSAVAPSRTFNFSFGPQAISSSTGNLEIGIEGFLCDAPSNTAALDDLVIDAAAPPATATSTPSTTTTPTPTSTPSGNCCLPQTGPGCNNELCRNVVCADNVWCCQVQWDEACVADALGQPECACASPTPTLTPSPTNTATGTPTMTPSLSGTPTLTATPTLTSTSTSTPTHTPTLTPSSTPSRTPTLTNTPTVTATRTPTFTPTRSPSVTPSSTPSRTRTPTNTPTATSTRTPTVSPTLPTATPSHTPTGFIVSGQITYAGSAAPVPGAEVNLIGPHNATTQTDATGFYQFFGLSLGTWSVVPRKDDQATQSIGAADVQLTLEAAVGLESLSSHQMLACDVSGNGSVSGYDGAIQLQLIAQTVDSSPAADQCNSKWGFIPVPTPVPGSSAVQPQLTGGSCQPGQLVFEPLAQSAAGQNFVGVVFGDCNVDWQPAP